jgi:hypothetical protein
LKPVRWSDGVTKRYDESIEVTADPLQRGAPLAFVWRGRRYEVDRPLSVWREAGAWWTSEPHEDEYHRVLARPAGVLSDGAVDPDGFMNGAGAVFDLCLDRLRGTWRVARLWD